MSRVIQAFAQFFDESGDPVENGWLEFLVSGTNNTQKDTYSDDNQTIPNSNPVQLDAGGRCPDIFGEGLYRVVLYAKNPVTGLKGEQLQVFDPVQSDYVPEGSTADFQEWLSTTVYEVGNIVKVSNDYYRSIIGTNFNNYPLTNADKWEQVDFTRFWNSAVTYQTDDISVYNGILYVSLQDSNINKNPVSEPTWWEAVGTGTVLVYWEEFGTTFRPKLSGYDIGSASNYVGDIYMGQKTLYIGLSQDMKITHTGTEGRVLSGSGDSLVLGGGNTRQWEFTSSGNFVPISDGFYDIGADTFRPYDLYLERYLRLGTTGAEVLLSYSGGNLNVSGGIIFTGGLRISDGTEAAPAYSFSSDIDTGIYRILSDAIAISLGGSTKWVMSGNDLLPGSTGVADIGALAARLVDIHVGGKVVVGTNVIDTTYISGDGSNNLMITTNGSEAIRVSSTGFVGIGTTTPDSYSPISKLTVSGSSHNAVTIASGSSSIGAIYFADGTTGDQVNEGSISYNHTNNSLYIGVNHVSRYQIDSLGNFGINNPALLTSWDSTVTAVQIGSSGSIIATTAKNPGNELTLTQNAYYDGSWKYIQGDEATKYTTQNGAHVFSVAASGSADAAITWIEAMRIHLNGRVGIGLSPVAQLDVLCSGANTALRVVNTGGGTGFTVNAKYGLMLSQDISDGYGLLVFRNNASSETTPLITFKNQNASDTKATLALNNVGSGAHISTVDSNEDLEISPNGTGRLVAIANVSGSAGLHDFQNRINVAGSLIGLTLSTTEGEGTTRVRSEIIGGVDGSDGGYLSFSTRLSGSITERMIIDSNGNVGIGTTTPSALLHVRDDSVNADTEIRLSNDVQGWRFKTMGSDGDKLYIDNGTTNVITINTSNQVGIGTASPGGKLHVYGAHSSSVPITFQSTVSNYINITRGDAVTDNNLLRFTSTANGTTNWTIGNFANTEDLYFSQDTTSNPRMVITNGGNIGFGTTNIHDWRSGYVATQWGGNGAIYANNDTSASNSLIIVQNAYRNDTDWYYVSTDEATLLSTSGGNYNFNVAASGTADTAVTWTTALFINNSGNVGIGNSSLESWDSTWSALQFGAEGSIGSPISGGSLHLARNAYYDGADWKYQTTDPASNYYLGNGTHLFRVVASGTADTAITWTNAFYIDVSGNVGIRNTSLEAWNSSYTALQIGGTASIIADSDSTVSNNLYIMQNCYYDGSWKYQVTDEASLYFQRSGTHKFNVITSGTADTAITWTEALIIDSSGNVGIGTITPSTNLHVYDATVNNVALFESGDAGCGILLKDSNTTGSNVVGAITDDLYFSTSSTERMRINSSGNVGIGNSSLEAWSSSLSVLQVGGNASILANTAAGVGKGLYIAQNAYSDGSWKYQDTYEASLYYQTGGNHYFAVAVSGTADTAVTWVDALKIDYSGKVGIGTSNPSNVLTVKSASTNSEVLAVEASGGTNDIFKIQENSSGHGILDVHDSSGVKIRLHTAGSSYFTGGSVGIGTSSPLCSLDVGNVTANYGTVGIVSDTNHRALQLEENSGGESWSLGVNADGDLGFMNSGATFVNSSLIINDSGNIIFTGCLKSDTGDPTGSEGMLTINTFDNAIKIYADGAWRTLSSW